MMPVRMSTRSIGCGVSRPVSSVPSREAVYGGLDFACKHLKCLYDLPTFKRIAVKTKEEVEACWNFYTWL